MCRGTFILSSQHVNRARLDGDERRLSAHAFRLSRSSSATVSTVARHHPRAQFGSLLFNATIPIAGRVSARGKVPESWRSTWRHSSTATPGVFFRNSGPVGHGRPPLLRKLGIIILFFRQVVASTECVRVVQLVRGEREIVVCFRTRFTSQCHLAATQLTVADFLASSRTQPTRTSRSPQTFCFVFYFS